MTPPQEQQPLPAPRKKSHLAMIYVPFILFLILIAFFAGAWIGQDEGEEIVLDEDLDDCGDDGCGIEDDYEDEETGEVEVLEDADTLSISWLANSEQVEVDAIRDLTRLFGDYAYDSIDSLAEDGYEATAHLLGEVDSGTYDGYQLSMHVMPIGGMGVSYHYFYVLDGGDEGDLPLLLNYEGYVYFMGPTGDRSITERYEDTIGDLTSSFVFATDLVVPEIEMEDEIEDVDGHPFMYTGVSHRLDHSEAEDFHTTEYSQATHLSDGEMLYLTDPAEDSSTPAKNQWFSIREDGRSVWYDAKVPFWPSEESLVTAVPEVTFSGGVVNEETYVKGGAGGCGFSTLTNVRDESELPEMQDAGTFTYESGETGTVYAPVSYESEYYQDAFDVWVLHFANEEDPTWEEFIGAHPYFYWVDDFGRWIEFKSSEVMPAAECAKPAIYLYPEEPMQVSVWVDPKGGFTYTEPDYGDGWEVIAFPDGHLLNLADREEYPYLWWDGRGELYAEPDMYWVVAQSDVKPFLVKTLFKLGLNLEETMDFLEYWLPHMNEAPHYKIGFHGANVLDELAPLDFSAEPDMILRILMDYEPLAQPIEENPPLLGPRPIREGFSVIEWGGVKR